jgi:hypothetical protein
MYAIGAVGNALNAYENSRASMDANSRQTEQIRQRVAFEKVALAKQIAIRDQEIARQQLMARAVADSLNNSKGQYANVEGDVGAKSGQISDAFRSILSHQAGGAAVPVATGATADKQAALSALATSDANRNADNLAKTQALGEVFTDKGRALTRNNQVSGMLRNFAQGSGQVAQQEMQAPTGKFFQQDIVKPAPSVLGDLFYGLSMGGLAYANQPKTQPTTGSGSMYSLPTLDEYKASTGTNPFSYQSNGLGIK